MARDRPEAADRALSSQQCILGSASVPASLLRPAASEDNDQRALIHLPPFLCTLFASTVALLSHDQGTCPRFGLLSLSNRPPQNVVNQTKQPRCLYSSGAVRFGLSGAACLLVLLVVTCTAVVRFSWAAAGLAGPPRVPVFPGSLRGSSQMFWCFTASWK